MKRNQQAPLNQERESRLVRAESCACEAQGFQARRENFFGPLASEARSKGAKSGDSCAMSYDKSKQAHETKCKLTSTNQVQASTSHSYNFAQTMYSLASLHLKTSKRFESRLPPQKLASRASLQAGLTRKQLNLPRALNGLLLTLALCTLLASCAEQGASEPKERADLAPSSQTVLQAASAPIATASAADNSKATAATPPASSAPQSGSTSSIVASLSSAVVSAAAAAAAAAAQSSLQTSDARSILNHGNAGSGAAHAAAHHASQRSPGLHLALKLADAIPEVPFSILHNMKKLDHAAPFYNVGHRVANLGSSKESSHGMLSSALSASGGLNGAAEHLSALFRSPIWKRLADGYGEFTSEFRSLFRAPPTTMKGPTSSASKLLRDISVPALLMLLASSMPNEVS